MEELIRDYGNTKPEASLKNNSKIERLLRCGAENNFQCTNTYTSNYFLSTPRTHLNLEIIQTIRDTYNLETLKQFELLRRSQFELASLIAEKH